MASNTSSECTVEAIPCTSKEVNRLGMCEVCNTNPAKYTCPNCEVKTCRIYCSTIHKKELNCDGKRNKAKFIPLNKFTNLDLSSDICFLEEITRSVENLKKNSLGKYTPHEKQLPFYLQKLQNAAQARRVTLKFLPMNFVRHKRNTTRHNYQSNILHWRIEWIFVNADNLLMVEEKVSEIKKISNIYQKYLVKQEDAVVQEKLQYYQSADLPGIRLLLRAEGKAGNYYYELDPSLSFKENFKNKIIIEYPTIYVVLKEHSNTYNIIDSDDEHDVMEVDRVSSGKDVVERIIKNAEKEDSLYSSLKNLLFISEYSDTEN